MYFAALTLAGATLGQPAPVPSSAPLTAVQDYVFVKDREIVLPIKYVQSRNTIRKVILYVARNGENFWELQSTLTPDREKFQYTAKEDGVYWFTMVEEDLQGHKNPAEVTKTPPDLKIIVDTVKPRIQFTTTHRSADSVDIGWLVDDKYPDDNSTKVHFKPASAADTAWREVSLPANSKTGVKFSPGTTEPIHVRVTAFDLAKNKTEAIWSFPAPNTATVSTSLSPQTATVPPAVPTPTAVTETAVAKPPVGLPVTPSPDAFGPIGPVAPTPPVGLVVTPPSVVTPPVAPAVVTPNVPPVVPTTTAAVTVSGEKGPFPVQASVDLTVPLPTQTPTVPPQPSSNIYGTPAGGITAPMLPGHTLETAGGRSPSVGGVANEVVPAVPVVPTSPGYPSSPNLNTTPVTTPGPSLVPNPTLPTFEPHQNPVPAMPAPSTGSAAPTPVAVWTGQPPAMSSLESSRASVINYLAFDVGYEVESRGPSGISRLDLWVTRDEGRTWIKWPGFHDGKATSIRVNLNVPTNAQTEGTYGFRVVPVSGAGLSEREPTAGDAPDLRVIVDVTPPQLDLFQPVSDPTNPDTLVIQWKATDKNFTDEPITIEWSDKPTGPWQPVASGSDVVQAVAGSSPILKKLPNLVSVPTVVVAGVTGQYAWRIPTGLPPRVFLKVCARDAAGNVREVITRDPILVDLIKPRAKINGILAPQGTSLPKP